MIFLAEIGGFEKIINLLDNNEKPNQEIVHIIFYIFSQCSSLFHKEYAAKLGNELKNKIFNYINDLSQNELRNLKKETLDLINKVLKLFLNVLHNKDDKNRILQNFNISFSIKMLKSSFLEKRISVNFIFKILGDKNVS